MANARECIVCQKLFIPNSAPQKYCSRKCNLEARRQRRAKERICPICNKGFLPNGNQQIFCSQVCYKVHRTIKNRTRHKRTCIFCGIHFTSRNPDQSYCSRQCYATSNKGKLRKIKAPYKTCLVCKQLYDGAKEQMYCSRLCKNIALQKRETINCIQCQMPFEVRQSQMHRKKFCCRACKSAYMSKRLQLTCKHCHGDFIAQIWDAERGQAYCSKKCADAALLKRISCKCAHCGKEMERIPSHVQHGEKAYCSKLCANEGLRKEWTDAQLLEMCRTDTKYKHSWRLLADTIRRRDDYTCQHCGIQQYKPALAVHHIRPLSTFTADELPLANTPNNLISLCGSCHKTVEDNPELLSLDRRDLTQEYLIRLLVS